MSNNGSSDLASPPPAASRSRALRGLAVLFGRDAIGAPGDAGKPPGPAGDGVAGGTESTLQAKLRLVTLSFLMLFVELALIRWTGANIIYLSYFSNFVLLGSFLGIGIGFLRARARVNLFPWVAIVLALLIIFVRAFPVQINRAGTQLIFFAAGDESGLPTWVTLPVIFLCVAAVMATIGEGVARSFVKFRPLDAYRLDIFGSILGISAFSLLSFLDAKPVVWGSIVALARFVLYGRRIGLVQVVALVSLVLVLWSESLSSTDIWSPYYRISVFPHSTDVGIEVNGIPHQDIVSTRNLGSVYSLPYVYDPANPLNNVLIIGAGTGNDTANALREGAKHVDAVEIDPQLQKIGSRLHPNHPYQDPRVTVHINDGRAFLQQTKTKYDMILFALYNYYRTTWLKDRLANTLDVVYGHAPCASTNDSALSMLAVSVNASTVHCGNLWQRPSTVVPPATDNHPFVYLDGNSIPRLYLVTLGLVLLASILLVRPVSGPYRRMTSYIDLFFMGAAFMLLETKNVTQFALLFGTTWFVNALVFGGVLV